MMRRRTFLGSGLAANAIYVMPRAAFAEDAEEVILGRLRSLRQDKGFLDLLPHSALTEMARLQAQYIRRLGRTSHIGADGSAPPARGLNADYCGCILGEVLAETREGPLETLEAWLFDDDTRDVLFDPRAREVGLVGLRDGTGLVHWDLVLGA